MERKEEGGRHDYGGTITSCCIFTFGSFSVEHWDLGIIILHRIMGLVSYQISWLFE